MNSRSWRRRCTATGMHRLRSRSQTATMSSRRAGCGTVRPTCLWRLARGTLVRNTYSYSTIPGQASPLTEMVLAAEMVNLTAADITIDFAAMGLNQETTALEVPALAGFNDPVVGARIALPSCSAAALARLVIPVSGNKGWVLRLRGHNTTAV